ncbi:E3 SUMO-protein ligase ZNF451 isoform X2 [Octopus bimaculoides]|nr:E3 SUMO-protein ligase ZNF451 isoform X2 [Octopus bimaculoides]
MRQACTIPFSPFRPFHSRWSVRGYKHLASRPTIISRPTIRRRKLVHGRGGFDVHHRRRKIDGQNHRQACSFTFRPRFRHRHYRMNPLKHKLCRMDHIIFWDIDNWSRFFEKLKFLLPPNTFVWGFHSTQWNQPTRCLAFHRLMSTGGFHKNYQSGRTKNAADFAMMLQIGKMDELLPKHVQFTIFSGDKGFQEALHQMKDSRRMIRIINPHVPGWQARLHNILNRTIP